MMDLLRSAQDPLLLLVILGLVRLLVQRLTMLWALALVLRGSRPCRRAALLDGLARFLHPNRR